MAFRSALKKLTLGRGRSRSETDRSDVTAAYAVEGDEEDDDGLMVTKRTTKTRDTQSTESSGVRGTSMASAAAAAAAAVFAKKQAEDDDADRLSCDDEEEALAREKPSQKPSSQQRPPETAPPPQPAQEHPVYVQPRLRKIARKVVFVLSFQRDGGVTLRSVARRARKRFNTMHKDLENEKELDFLTKMLSNLPLLMKETSALTQIFGLMNSNGSKYEVMDAIAVGMHTVKKVTMRVCWAEYLGPLKDEHEKLVHHHADLKEQFNEVRSTYLMDIAKLRDLCYGRADNDPMQLLDEKDQNITYFYDPVASLTAEELAFVGNVVKEKLKMIIQKGDAGKIAFNMGQLEALEQRISGKEIEELRRALDVQKKECHTMKVRLRRLEKETAEQKYMLEHETPVSGEQKVIINALEGRIADLKDQIMTRDAENKALKKLAKDNGGDINDLEIDPKDLHVSRTARGKKKKPESEDEEKAPQDLDADDDLPITKAKKLLAREVSEREASSSADQPGGKEDVATPLEPAQAPPLAPEPEQEAQALPTELPPEFVVEDILERPTSGLRRRSNRKDTTHEADQNAHVNSCASQVVETYTGVRLLAGSFSETIQKKLAELDLFASRSASADLEVSKFNLTAATASTSELRRFIELQCAKRQQDFASFLAAYEVSTLRWADDLQSQQAEVDWRASVDNAMVDIRRLWEELLVKVEQSVIASLRWTTDTHKFLAKAEALQRPSAAAPQACESPAPQEAPPDRESGRRRGEHRATPPEKTERTQEARPRRRSLEPSQKELPSTPPAGSKQAIWRTTDSEEEPRAIVVTSSGEQPSSHRPVYFDDPTERERMSPESPVAQGSRPVQLPSLSGAEAMSPRAAGGRLRRGATGGAAGSAGDGHRPPGGGHAETAAVGDSLAIDTRGQEPGSPGQTRGTAPKGGKRVVGGLAPLTVSRAAAPGDSAELAIETNPGDTSPKLPTGRHARGRGLAAPVPARAPPGGAASADLTAGDLDLALDISGVERPRAGPPSPAPVRPLDFVAAQVPEAPEVARPPVGGRTPPAALEGLTIDLAAASGIFGKNAPKPPGGGPPTGWAAVHPPASTSPTGQATPPAAGPGEARKLAINTRSGDPASRPQLQAPAQPPGPAPKKPGKPSTFRTLARVGDAFDPPGLSVASGSGTSAGQSPTGAGKVAQEGSSPLAGGGSGKKTRKGAADFASLT